MPDVPSKLQVNFDNIKHLSPAFVAAINLEIAEAFRDCNNRPKLKKAREVNLQISFTPVVDEESSDPDAFEVDVNYAVSPVKRPKRCAERSRVAINKQNQGFFHTDFHQEPNRKGMFDEQVAKEKK